MKRRLFVTRFIMISFVTHKYIDIAAAGMYLN
jgi:hypothetical protein